MMSYVCISDLVMNGTKGCTILEKEPYVDHISIVENDRCNSGMGIVEITYNGTIIFRRTMRSDVMESEKWLTNIDLECARAALFRDRLCSGCRYYNSQYFWDCDLDCDTWDNYKTGSCPCKTQRPESWIRCSK